MAKSLIPWSIVLFLLGTNVLTYCKFHVANVDFHDAKGDRKKYRTYFHDASMEQRIVTGAAIDAKADLEMCMRRLYECEAACPLH